MIDAILRDGARRHADRTAVVTGDDQLTYGELEHVANVLASDLLGRGIRPGDRIGLYGPNSWHWIASYHAIAKAGCVAIPLNALLTPEEVDFILADAGAVVLIGAEERRAALDAVAAAPGVERRSFAELDEMRSRPPGDPPPPVTGPDAVASIAYTSGTTGHPKGAVQTHRSVATNIALTATMHVRTAADTVVTALPAPHVYGNVVVNSILLAGGTVVMLERFDPANALDAIARYGATMFEGVPSMYSMIVTCSEWDRADLSSIRIATVGGQTIAGSVVEEWERRAHAPLLELWGMTEISGLGSTHPAHAPNVHGSIGVSLPGVGLRVCRLDEPMVEAAPGEAGELHVRGPIVMREYHGKPEATSDAFTPDGWLLTGDVATLDQSGYVRIVDRRKDMILSGGYNVYPAEVERVVAGCPGVALVTVAGVDDERLGEIPKAYVVRRDDTLTSDDVLGFCRERLARYKVPREVVFVDDLPRTSTGKLMRRGLDKFEPSTDIEP